MKTLLRLIAILMLGFVIFALPLSLFVKDLGSLLFDPETSKSFVRSTLLQEDFAANIANQAVQSLLTAGDESDDPASVIVQKGLEQLDEDDWAEVISIVAPSELIAGSADLLIEAYADWLNGDEEIPEIYLDLVPWKENIADNSDQLIETVLAALPACSTEDLAILAIESLTNGKEAIGSIPACNPPEPLLSIVISNAKAIVPRFLQAAPSEFDLSTLEINGLNQLIQLKGTLNRVRFLVNWSWLIILSVGVVAILLGTQTLLGALKWTGWSLFLTGLITIGLSQVLEAFSNRWLGSLLSNMFDENAEIAITTLSGVLGNAIELAGSRLAIQAGVILAAAVLALVLRQVIPYWQVNAENE
jgi:hypothetical protein